METLFVYGTLQEAQVQQRLLGRTLDSVSATLQGYRLDAVLFAPYLVAIPSQAATIVGQLLTVTMADMYTLDIYEGQAYLRVQAATTSAQSVWVYVVNPIYITE